MWFLEYCCDCVVFLLRSLYRLHCLLCRLGLFSLMNRSHHSLFPSLSPLVSLCFLKPRPCLCSANTSRMFLLQLLLLFLLLIFHLPSLVSSLWSCLSSCWISYFLFSLCSRDWTSKRVPITVYLGVCYSIYTLRISVARDHVYFTPLVPGTHSRPLNVCG
jgi:hypothetical protein